nr:l-pipecolate oxidase [Quercus suber]
MAAGKSIPSSILIVGSGVYGLSTAHALSQRPGFENCGITLLERMEFPAMDAASIDSSRIVRADYADGAYTSLMGEGMQHWRGDFGADGRYTESGLCIVMDEGDSVSEGDHAASQTYMKKSMENVKSRLNLKIGSRADGGQLEPLENKQDVQRVIGANMGGHVGSHGYVNWTSGWADAEAAMRYMRGRLAKTKSVDFRTAEVKKLHYACDRVESVELDSGEQLTADLVILATGAWTPRFVDLRGVASATGQVLAYLQLTPEEQERLGSNPALICENSGMFIIPPRDRILKVARHGFGYANMITIPHPERHAEGERITVSLPRTKTDDPSLQIPKEAQDACRDFLAKTIPTLANREWVNTRICWYTDTPDGNWLIDYHPRYENLFIATGGSGHGYKFLPVIGDRILDVILQKDRDELGEELRQKWRWPAKKFAEDHIWTDDWRGGRKGMYLDEELRRK